jgi:hypothetical protein
VGEVPAEQIRELVRCGERGKHPEHLIGLGARVAEEERPARRQLDLTWPDRVAVLEADFVRFPPVQVRRHLRALVVAGGLGVVEAVIKKVPVPRQSDVEPAEVDLAEELLPGGVAGPDEAELRPPFLTDLRRRVDLGSVAVGLIPGVRPESVQVDRVVDDVDVGMDRPGDVFVMLVGLLGLVGEGWDVLPVVWHRDVGVKRNPVV